MLARLFGKGLVDNKLRNFRLNSEYFIKNIIHGSSQPNATK